MRTELEFINSGIDSINGLNLSPNITVLNLHHNRISEINGLTKATSLRYLDLSSNYISKICGLDSLQHLRILNLSSNKIRSIDSLENLNCLVRLDVSFNEITSLVGLKKLFGPGYSLTAIILQGNQIQSKSHILECLKNLVNLRQLVLLNPQTGDSNPVCGEPGYLLSCDVCDFLDVVYFSAFYYDYISGQFSDLSQDLSMRTELEFINSGIDSINGLNLSPNITVLNLHHNRISEINGLTKATSLRYLDLSSNYISKICGLDNLQHLRILNLSSNKIRSIDSLENLNCLVRLDVSFNEITSLVGLKKLFGPGYSLTAIILQGNQIQSKSHILECLKNLVNLRQLVLLNPQTGDSNPVCGEPDYRLDLLQGLPQLEILDHVDRMGRSTQINVLADLPESQLNSLITSHLMKIYQTEHNHSTHHNNVLHSSSIQENNLKNGNTVVVHGKNEINSSKVKDTLDLCQYIPEKELVFSVTIASYCPFCLLRNIDPDKSLSQPVQQLSAQSLKNPNLNTFQRHNHSSTMKKQSVVDKNPSSTSTKSKSISGRLSQRTSAEKKTKHENSKRSNSTGLMNFNNQLTDQKHIQDVPVTMKISPNSNIQSYHHGKEMKTLNRFMLSCDSLLIIIYSFVIKAMDQHEALKVTEELKQAFTTEHQEKLLVQSQLKIIEQKFNDMCQIVDHLQAKENEVKDRYEREIENLNKLISELRADNKNALTRAENAEQKLDKTKTLLRNREADYELIDSTKRYTALEDEFRMALRIEAERYDTLLKTSDLCKNELINTQLQLKEMIEREESARCLIQELNTLLKTSDLCKNELINTQLQLKEMIEREESARCLIQELNTERIGTLEMHLEEAQTRIRNHENLRKELKQQKAEMTAQESIIAGLKAERRNWSEELAKQENQTEIKRLQNEGVQNRHNLESQLKQKIQVNTELDDEIKRLNKRKEDLKLLVGDLQSKIDELQEQNESMSQRWRDRASLIDKLEKQVEQMRHNWDEEQKVLIDERDTARKEISTLHSQMQAMDERFRQQLSSTEEMNDLAMNRVKNEAEQLRIACETRVAEVESEMRTILLEAENSRKATQERLRCISAALCAPISPHSKIHCINT
ncbi:leucine-rich repeat and coiled-coil domain-containing protein 1 [Schistosoma bovis]|uniref:Leucine-rich repeat and coiled-coil domain-containing protein 1 n=1 Tax=Schistosoma bovis TaxID=6184 RepID=A0A430QDB1_SCHBO|nr:leucine-rich repeat and coiled-coil domain-containing protein 1 [Schistosoma bovis]